MSQSQLSFLYVEDDPASRTIMLVMLRKILGYQNVTIFNDSTNFIERLAALPTVPDLFLLDINVGPTNGTDLLRLIRARPDYNLSKVVAVTASVTTSEVNSLKQAGFDALIGKPIKQAVFAQLIDQIVSGSPVWMVP